MLRFESAGHKWWNKPLVSFRDRPVPAELAVLSIELGAGESGAWMNSRGTDSGVVDIATENDTYVTQRVALPAFVSAALKHIYRTAQIARGCPDIVIWNSDTKRVRLVEVKCPHWDKPSKEQEMFLQAAESAGISAKIVEWEFRDARQGAAADRPASAVNTKLPIP